MRILLLVAVAAPLLALWPRQQDPANIDWAREVERACTSQRLGLRIAAARKVAKAGALAVPAIRAFADKQGLNQVPSTIVDSLADDAPVDAPTIQLLIDWAKTSDFYWRSAAMRGLALKAPHAGAQTDELRQLFVAMHADPAWLMRTHARFGTALLGDPLAAALPEDDPRAKVRLPMLLLLQDKPAPLQPLLDALADERTFQADAWGQRMAFEAHKVLKAWLGDAHPLKDGGSFADIATGLQALLAPCRKKSGQDLTLPVARTDAATQFIGGLELLSCKHGDQFVQWTADGVVHLGIDAGVALQLPAPTWDALTKNCADLAITGDLGVVVCDSIRLRLAAAQVHVKVAPASLPAAATNWLKRLAQAIEEAGEPRLAAAFRAGLEQFAAR